MMKKDLSEVHFLRGFASLAVAVYHLFCGNGNLFPEANVVKHIFSYGYLGVEVFFMLSGFIICYALPVNFSYRDIKPFLLKRLIRIEPPYVASILLVVALNSLSHAITSSQNDIDWQNLTFHLAYLNNFGTGAYVNVVYWTLGIEFQFYILLAAVFPLITGRLQFYILFAAIISLGFVRNPAGVNLIFPFLTIFGLGILIFFYRHRQMLTTMELSLISAVLFIEIYLLLSPAAFFASLVCYFTLLFWRFKTRIIFFFSSISFSLYLTHVPVGGKVVNLGLRFVHTTGQRYLLFAAALGISIAFAWLFYRLVEKPAMAWSKMISYKA
jgi:peptidoglycan/LPS O-acetylase OafA/YrhL